MDSPRSAMEYLQDQSISQEAKSEMCHKFLDQHLLSPDSIIRWLTSSICTDKSTRTSPFIWDLFTFIISSHLVAQDRLSIQLRPQLFIAEVYQSQASESLCTFLNHLALDYPNAWRPKFVDLCKALSDCITAKVAPKYLDQLIGSLSNHFELVAATDQVFKIVTESLFVALLANYPEKNAINFLASSICVPFFVRKAAGETHGSIVASFINDLNASQNSPIFIPQFIKSYFEQLKLLNISASMSFPILLASQCPDCAVAVIHECNHLKVYSVEKHSAAFDSLVALTSEAIAKKKGNLLIELLCLDHRLILPRLEEFFFDTETTTEGLACALLERAFSLRDPMLILKAGRFPSHVLEFPLFVQQFAEESCHLTSSQLLILLERLIVSSADEEAVLLYWALQKCRLTVEHENIIDLLISNCGSNPWRFTSAVLAAKRFRKPLPTFSDYSGKPSPVMLNCYLIENYGELEFRECCEASEIVNKVPTPQMKGEDGYRMWFIIHNLPILSRSLRRADLTKAERFIVRNSILAQNIAEPKTIADFCLLSLHNSDFYENHSIRSAFPRAVKPLLPNSDLQNEQSFTIETYLYSAIVAALPHPFISEEIAAAAFIGLILSNFSESEASPLFAPLMNRNQLLNLISDRLSSEFVQTNLDFIVHKDSGSFLSIIFEKNGGIPQILEPTKGFVISACEYSFLHRLDPPFSQCLFADDLDTACAELKARVPGSAEVIMDFEITEDNIAKIIEALSAREDLKEIIRDDFFSKWKNPSLKDEKSLSKLGSLLSSEQLMALLSAADPSIYPALLYSFDAEEIGKFEPYIIKALNLSPSPTTLKAITGLKLAHFYSKELINRILFLVAKSANSVKSLSEVGQLCSAAVQITVKCSKEVSSDATAILEVIRKLSSTFYRLSRTEKITMKNLKSISKLFNAISKSIRTDFLHYLLANFVGNIASASVSENMLKAIQSSSFPLFSRCDRSQLTEVSIALHESHRQIFQQLYDRWQKEAQYKGKV